MNQSAVGAPSTCHSKVELRISCTNLLDKDYLSKSDPLCALYVTDGKRWYEVYLFLFFFVFF